VALEEGLRTLCLKLRRDDSEEDVEGTSSEKKKGPRVSSLSHQGKNTSGLRWRQSLNERGRRVVDLEKSRKNRGGGTIFGQNLA